LYFIIIDIKKIEMFTTSDSIPLVYAKEFPPVPILSAYSTRLQAGVAVSLAVSLDSSSASYTTRCEA
jgi:hypothetical protein